MREDARDAHLGEGGLRGARRDGPGPRRRARRRPSTSPSATRIPLKFLEKILFDLRHAGLVATRRGPEGGYWLARDPAEITVADVLRAVDGPLADVHGLAPEDVEYEEGFAALQKVWVAVRTSLRSRPGVGDDRRPGRRQRCRRPIESSLAEPDVLGARAEVRASV